MGDETDSTDEATEGKSKTGCLWLFVVVVVFAVGATILSGVGGGSTDENQATDNGAIDVCHQAVADQLKAPGTADFGGERVERAVHAPGRYTVTGHVDAENSFGAALRLVWSCEATWQSGTNWNPVVATVTE